MIWGILVACVIGGIAGFLAGKIVEGHGFGIVGNVVVGIVGAAIFGWLFGNFNLFGGGLISNIAGGTIGAVILLFVIGLVKKA